MAFDLIDLFRRIAFSSSSGLRRRHGGNRKRKHFKRQGHLIVLARRIIPCLDVKNGRVVKGVKFVNLRDAGDPVECAKVYDRAGADELVFLDITASHEARPTTIRMVERVAESIYIPFTVGGGIQSLNDIRTLIKAGCDKVSLNTAAVKDPGLVKRASQRF